MERTRVNQGDELLARWESHRSSARRDAIITGMPVAGAGLDVIGLDPRDVAAKVLTLEPRRIPLLNGDILPTSA